MTDATHYVDLWLSNDQGLYGEAMETVAACRYPINADAADEGSDFNVADVSDALREMVSDNAEREFPFLFDHGSFVGDIFTNALASANWRELAESWIENVRESDRFSEI